MAVNYAFAASTGRTATTFLVKSLDSLPGVVAMHEGHTLTDDKIPILPLINIHNRKAWHDYGYACEIVKKMRNRAVMEEASGGSELCIDVAYYNSPLVIPLSEQYPGSPIIILFRRCEGFVRSATIVNGEDREPAGWPDPRKKLTPREQFISMGRLKPAKGTTEDLEWEKWSGLKRNIWLWSRVNEHLYKFAAKQPGCIVLYYETLRDSPADFWEKCLRGLNLLSSKNMDICLTCTESKVNARQSYDIGGYPTWSRDEQEMYVSMALPLEREIYE